MYMHVLGEEKKSGYQCSSFWYLHLHIHVDTCTCTWCISSSCPPTLPFTISFYLVPFPPPLVCYFSLPPPSPPPPNVCIRRANTDRRRLCYRSQAQGLLLPMWLWRYMYMCKCTAIVYSTSTVAMTSDSKILVCRYFKDVVAMYM